MDPFIGEIKLLPYGFQPKGWLDCNGQLLNIQQNAALYSLINTSYGGDGKTTFALPDLRGRVAMNWGDDGTGYVKPGLAAGSETVVLTSAQVPPHTHTFAVSKDSAVTDSPVGGYPAKGVNITWIAPVDQAEDMSSTMLTASGASAGHENRMPVLALRFCIAVTGYYPPRW